MPGQKSALKGFLVAQTAFTTALLIEVGASLTLGAAGGNEVAAEAFSKLQQLDLMLLPPAILITWLGLFVFSGLLNLVAGSIFRGMLRRKETMDFTTVAFCGVLVVTLAGASLTRIASGSTSPLTVDQLIFGYVLTLVNGAIFGLTYWHFGEPSSVSLRVRPWQDLGVGVGCTAAFYSLVEIVANGGIRI